MNDGPYERHVFIPDLHVPYHDPQAVAVAVAFVRELRPDHLWVLGDACDFYQLSRFDKDPARVTALQDDADQTADVLAGFRRAAPRARAHFIPGNHEGRLRKYLWTHATALARVRGNSIPELLSLAKVGFDYVESGQARIADLVIKHGNVVRTRAGNSANGELDRVGVSGVSAHTHRAGHVYRTNEAGDFMWLESGCLCDLHPVYLEGQTADWQHALAYGFLERGGNRFATHLMKIVNGRVIYDGREITARRA